MWIQEIINVVLENRTGNTFCQKSLWAHDGMNVVVRFAARCRWGALELTSAQYEAVEETSLDGDAFDPHFNTGSRFEVQECEGPLFLDGRDAVDIEFCAAKQAAGAQPAPDDGTLQAMSDFAWFAETYGVGPGDVPKLFETLSENGWTFLGHSYAVDGDIAVMRKSEYDYLWTGEDGPDGAAGATGTNPYAERIAFLHKQEEN